MGDRLLRADVVVWTGFFNESAAIYERVKGAPALAESHRRPRWIDVSRGASRVNVPTSTCEDYVEVSFMYGDPFFWLNPKNGGAIARNIAEGLAELRPEKRSLFLANARSFRTALNADIQRWQRELRPVEKLKVFSTQCGWQNFAQIGGPSFATCKGTPGQLPTPEVLAEHIRAMGCEVVLLDPNTPATYDHAFREQTKARIVEVPRRSAPSKAQRDTRISSTPSSRPCWLRRPALPGREAIGRPAVRRTEPTSLTEMSRFGRERSDVCCRSSYL